MYEINAVDVPSAYSEALWKMRVCAKPETSRNGPVLALDHPCLLTILNPRHRVLFDRTRNANPFFHVMEAIWMFAGSKDVRFPERFNKNYRNYADPDSDVVWGAYGYRWRQQFGVDQIRDVAALLKLDPGSRRAVMAMWDPHDDLDGRQHNDLPCNTHIYFRTNRANELEMTVCNRSNDLVWGMLGANVVHMTMLQELVALHAGLRIGRYQVFTNNLHVYPDMPNFRDIFTTLEEDNHYAHVSSMPLLIGNETLEEFLQDCETFVREPLSGPVRTYWMRHVARPMCDVHAYYKAGANVAAMKSIERIAATDWRLACKQWILRRSASFATWTEPSPSMTDGQNDISGEENPPPATGTDTIVR